MDDLDIFFSTPDVLKTTLDLLPQEIIFIDDKYSVLWMNRAKKESHPELEPGRKCHRAFGARARCEFCLAEEARSLGSPLKNPVCIMTGVHHNIPRHINIIIAPVALKGKNTRGFIEIVDNVEALYQTNSELERLNHEYENVIYALSHDLRSPLISIDGFLRKLEKSIQNNDAATLQHCIDRIHANTTTMNTLVNVLLDTSRIITGILDLHENDMGKIAREMAEQYSTRAAEQGAKITVKGDFQVEMCDKVRIQQVYSNLIGNSLKHCHACRDLVIELGADGHVYWVRDNGPGMPPDFLDVVFEPFTQGKKGSKEDFGMGMNIVYRIIQKHSGDVWIESKEGAGTTVFFTFKGALDEETE